MSEQPYLFGSDAGPWIPIRDGDPTGMSIFLRHYTARERRKVFQFVGPGEKEVLITQDAKALFVWRKFISDAGETGINCAVFRNEGAGLSSDLILAADAVAARRWRRGDGLVSACTRMLTHLKFDTSAIRGDAS